MIRNILFLNDEEQACGVLFLWQKYQKTEPGNSSGPTTGKGPQAGRLALKEAAENDNGARRPRISCAGRVARVCIFGDA